MSGHKIPLQTKVRQGYSWGSPSKDENTHSNRNHPGFFSFKNIFRFISNLHVVHHYRQLIEPHMFLLTEVQLTPKPSINNRVFPVYELHTSFRHHSWVCAYLRRDHPCTQLSRLESTRSDIIWVKVAFNSSS